MSNIYSTEPPTSGKVIVKTNYGNIDFELWTKEAPRACRNFIQLCLEGYFNNCIFHRIIKEFMIQTGDPTNTGTGGESIWNKEFTDEFHSRLRFNHRGIVAMANSNKPNTNGSQFFITMDKCPWLDKKHTIFGKVVGDTFFNALTISQVDTKDDYPICDSVPVIIKIEVIINPFDDIVPRDVSKKRTQTNVGMEHIRPRQEEKIENLQNKKLLSFDDDLEGENDCNNTATNSFKIKAIHQAVKNDKKLVNKPIVDHYSKPKNSGTDDSSLSSLKARVNKLSNINAPAKNQLNEESESDSEDEWKGGLTQEEIKLSSDRNNEILQVKQDILRIKKRIEDPDEERRRQEEMRLFTPLQKMNEKYLNMKKSRQSTKETIEKMERFKDKLKNSKEDENSWMNNKLRFHVDSQKAYAINEGKEKQAKNFDFDAFSAIDPKK